MSERKMGSMSVKEAGSLGGRTNVERHGHEHFSRIGTKGGQKTAERGPEFFQAIGKKGGAAHRDKIATIKALADALWESGEQDPDGAWHSSGCDHWTSNGERCGEHCQQRRAALRLAGRL